MENRDKYDEVFITCFGVSKAQLNAQFVYQCVPSWDSVGHMGLISALEEAFDIMMEMDDVIDFGSYTIGIETLKKYGIAV